MSQPRIELEIHAPGLDLHRERWNYHVMFMDEVHRNVDTLFEVAHSFYGKQGRGAIYVGPKQWMEIIEGEWKQNGAFPCDYLTSNSRPQSIDFGVLGAGFRQMIDEYDPAAQLILAVLHHPGEMLSAYMIRVVSS